MLSCWYTREELGKRIALILSMWPAARMLVTLGVLADPSLPESIFPPEALRTLYVYYLRASGLTAIVGAVGMCQTLPNVPQSTTWLNCTNRQVALGRLAEEYGWAHPNYYEDKGPWWFHSVVGFCRALRDVKMYILVSLPSRDQSMESFTDNSITSQRLYYAFVFHFRYTHWDP